MQKHPSRNRGIVMRAIALWTTLATLAVLAAVSLFPSAAAPTASHDDLDHKLVVGFQGWFTCPTDALAHGRWVHWFAGNKPDAAHFRVDLMPDMSELQPDERCPTTLKSANGPVYLFSDQNPKTVLRQFQWMQQYDIDVAAPERFVVDLD